MIKRHGYCAEKSNAQLGGGKPYEMSARGILGNLSAHDAANTQPEQKGGDEYCDSFGIDSEDDVQDTLPSDLINERSEAGKQEDGCELGDLVHR